jgi:unsaturated chondroitin disaccharide hydrolase
VEAWHRRALDTALERVERASRELVDFPHVTEAGEWVTYPDGAWTGGFWIGQLWLLYRETRVPEARERAAHFLERLLSRRTEAQNHDLGMMFYPSAVVGWRLTGDPAYRQAAIDAARALAAQAQPTSGLIPGWGFFGGDDWEGSSLVDTLMNLPLLVWAASEAGEPTLRRVAERHADVSVAHHLRPDGSAYHVYRFDPESGRPLHGDTYQGLGPESRWSRGLAWAIAGLALLGEGLSKPDYLLAARRAVGFYRAHVPDDLVPFWDFDAGGPDGDEPRDSSAAAIAAYGMLRLARATGDEDLRAYALRALRSLSEAYAEAAPRLALLGHATADLPHGLGIDGATAYGDYYYLKALVTAAAA